MTGRPINQNKELAILYGEKTYRGSEHTCGTNERYVTNGGCVHCTRDKQRIMRERSAAIDAAKEAAAAARRRAKQGLPPEDVSTAAPMLADVSPPRRAQRTTLGGPAMEALRALHGERPTTQTQLDDDLADLFGDAAIEQTAADLDDLFGDGGISAMEALRALHGERPDGPEPEPEMVSEPTAEELERWRIAEEAEAIIREFETEQGSTPDVNHDNEKDPLADLM